MFNRVIRKENWVAQNMRV